MRRLAFLAPLFLFGCTSQEIEPEEVAMEATLPELVKEAHEFRTSYFAANKEVFKRSGNEDNPTTLFITCSDSRVTPSLLTDSGPGDLFMVRNPGNFVPVFGKGGSESAAIEYAVETLGVSDIVLCGHSECSTIETLLTPPKGQPALASWLWEGTTVRKILTDHYHDLSEEERLPAAVEENVLVQLEQLSTHPSVVSALRSGALKLHGWVFDSGSGSLFTFDPESGQFRKK